MGALPLSLLFLVLGPSLQTGPPLPAAPPVVENRAFVVVWNVPTARCQDQYGVHLDLGHFDIVENREQSFQGQRMTIFYRDRLGKYPYVSRDGVEVNGGLPQTGHLQDHLSLMSEQLSVRLQPNFTGLAVVDWEEWRPLWETNFGTKMVYRRRSKRLVERQRPDWSERAVSEMARRRFEENARRFMESTLLLAVNHRPKGLWGFYGFPNCFNKKKKKNTSQTYTGQCHKGTRRNNERLSWLWTQSTALYPSIYLPQSMGGSVDGALMVRHRVQEALRVASRWRHGNHSSQATPTLPYARLAFTHTLNFLSEADLEHTLGESASLGAAGVVLWGEMTFAKSRKQCVRLRDYIDRHLGPFIQSLRSDTQRCSLLRCHGNGRCAQRRPASTGVDPKLRIHNESHTQLACQCYVGWTGQRCEVFS